MSGFLSGNGLIRLFMESDNCVVFFPSVVRRTTDDVLVIGNDLTEGPFETLTNVNTVCGLVESFGNHPEVFTWRQCHDILTFTYGGGILIYRTDKSIWKAMEAIANSNYPFADELKKILKDVLG